MNLEGLTLKLVNDTLNKELLGSKIYRVYMPNPHAVLLLLRRTGDTGSLLADMNGGSPALYIPVRLPENPETPPGFCMLLRKHLEEGRIAKIFQSGLDRIITLEIDMLGQAGKIITKKLIFELTGKNNNVILVQDNMIIGCLKHVGAAQSSYRCVLPGREYIAPPPQAGLNILTEKPEAIVQAANNLPDANFAKALVAATTGIGKATAAELLTAADILPQTVRLEQGEAQALTKVLADLQQHLADASTKAVYALISRTNQVKTILPLPPQNLEQGMSVREFADVNSAINFAVSLKPIQLPQHEQLQKLVTAESAKLTKKLTVLQQDLRHAEDAEAQRIIADTLMANIYQLHRGQTDAELINIYDGEKVHVKLNPVLSPTENAQAYYKRYNKYKRAQIEVRRQIEAAQEMLTYLASLDVSLLTATTKNEIEEIRQEMINVGLIKLIGKKKTKASLQKSRPLHIKINAEVDLYIGKNNKQNDYVTFTLGGPRDLWFHTKNIPGSHVIMKGRPQESDVQLAVQLAAYFSKAGAGSNVPVDCVERRYVKKPAGSKPGFVIFTNQRTYYTTPDKQLLAAYLPKD